MIKHMLYTYKTPQFLQIPQNIQAISEKNKYQLLLLLFFCCLSFTYLSLTQLENFTIDVVTFEAHDFTEASRFGARFVGDL